MNVSTQIRDKTLQRALIRTAELASDTEPLALLTSKYAIGHIGGRTITAALECTHSGRKDQVALHTRTPVLDLPRCSLTVPICVLWVPLHTRLEGRCTVGIAPDVHEPVTVTGMLRGYSTPGVCPTCTKRLVESQLQEVLMAHATASGSLAGRLATSLRTLRRTGIARKLQRPGNVTK